MSHNTKSGFFSSYFRGKEPCGSLFRQVLFVLERVPDVLDVIVIFQRIQRIIKKAEGGDKTEFEAITYEGYGPGGVAVMVETLTDNRNRTAADLRHYFDKNGGNLGAMGCVAFLFNQKGVIDISLEDKDADEAMMDALDAGAEDFDASEDAAEVTTDPENYSAVVKALEEKGYEILSDDLAMVPMTTTRLTDPDQLKLMGKLLDALEDNDDVQNVWHSLENEEDLPE